MNTEKNTKRVQYGVAKFVNGNLLILTTSGRFLPQRNVGINAAQQKAYVYRDSAERLVRRYRQTGGDYMVIEFFAALRK